MIEHLGKMGHIMLRQAFPLLAGEVAAFFNQVPNTLLRLVPVEMNSIISISARILGKAGEFDALSIAPRCQFFRGVARVAALMPQKSGALLGIVSLHEVGINPDSASFKAESTH